MLCSSYVMKGASRAEGEKDSKKVEMLYPFGQNNTELQQRLWLLIVLTNAVDDKEATLPRKY
jgi:hypothetical protein